MGYIHCCGRLIKAKTFVLDCPPGYTESILLYAPICPHCENTILVILRTNHLSEVETIRKTNEKARKLLDKLRLSIRFEITNGSSKELPSSKSYLPYNHFGVIKRCYSNLSTLKLGLLDPYSHLDFIKALKHEDLISK